MEQKLREDYKNGEILDKEDINDITKQVNINTSSISNLQSSINNLEEKSQWEDFV